MKMNHFLICILILLLPCVVVCPARAADMFEAIELLPDEYKHRAVQQLSLAEGNQDELVAAITSVKEEHRAAIGFLISNMPEADLKTLKKEYLLNNIELAYKARAQVPWGEAMPDELFLESVLPYASVNEQRDAWRQEFYDKFIAIAKECKTPGEVVERLNVEAFETYGVKYHASKRPKPDMSPSESIEAKYASCTGLSIFLIDACRAVCVPARFVGTPRWNTKQGGNHSWVEAWDRQWNYIGACEGNKLNWAWFAGVASKADGEKPLMRIYATSFQQTDQHFPLVWQMANREVPAVDVTPFYTARRAVTIHLVDANDKPITGAALTLHHGGRIVARDVSGTQPLAFHLAAGEAYAAHITTGAADQAVATKHTFTLGQEESPSVKITVKTP